MFKEIPGNLNLNLFLEILLVFHQTLLLNCYKTMRKKKNLLSDSSKKRQYSTTYNYSSEFNYYFPYLNTFSFPILSFLCWSKRVITVREDRDIKKL